ncbi:MAG: ABC transporter substrate-binding protein [Spirochaetaceae bacterium]|nr:MAG: ABC transporter substrate-binding protein [Spirochaetaceae bacterium]
MKPWIVFIAVGLLAAAMCWGSSQGEESVLQDVDPTGVEITYWHQFTRFQQETLEALVEEFNNTNQWNIKVTAEFGGRYNDLYNKMVTAIAAGRVPDLVAAYQNEAAAYQVSGALVDINDYIDDPQWGLGEERSDYFEGFLQQDVNAQFGGSRLGFPPNRSLELLYYNLDWLKQMGFSAPPKNWDEFYQMCKKATDPAKNQYGYAINTGASNVFGQVISRGGEVAKADGSGYTYNTRQMKDSMAFMKKLYDEGASRKIAEQYGEQNDFANWKVLFTMSSTAGLPYYAGSVAKGEQGPFDWSVGAVPHTTARPALDIYGASVSIPKSTPQRQLAAWLLVKYLTQPGPQAKWVEATNYFPVRKSTAEQLGTYLSKNPNYKTAYDLLLGSDAKAEPPFAGYAEVRDAVEAAFNKILDGADIDATLRDLDEEANKIHQEAAP